MAPEITLSSAFNGLSGLVLMGLGLAILLVRPRRGQNTVLAVFLILFGLRFALVNTAGILGPKATAWTPFLIGVGAAAAYVASAAMLVLALTYPRPLGPGERFRILTVPVAANFLALIAVFAVLLDDTSIAEQTYADFAAVPYAVGVADLGSLLLSIVIQVLLLGVIAMRYPSMEPRQRPPAVLLAAAMTLYTAFLWGVSFAAPLPGLRRISFVGAGLMVLSAGLWIYATSRVPAEDRPRARNMVFLGLGVYLLAALLSLSIGLEAINDTMLPGLFRLMGAAALAYAILRHQLLGLDVKARWTISKSTVAGVFIAAFFVVSEAAQEFFQSSSNSAYWGIAAAGALVFAFSPLQRLADRIARRAVPEPVPSQPSPYDRAAAEDLYRQAVRNALHDDRVSAAESLYLAELGERLGLGARRALQVRRSVERKVRTGRA